MSHRLSVPFSCAVAIYWSRAVQMATVALEPWEVIVKRGSVEDSE